MIDLIKLHALADGELSEGEAKLLREQVLISEEASRELSAIHNLKDCVRSKAQIFTCEITLKTSMKRVAELDRKHRVDSFVTRYAWGISGAFLVLIFAGGIMNRTTGSHRVQTADIASLFAQPNSAPQHAVPTADWNNYNHWLDGLIQNARGIASPPDLDGHQVVKAVLRDAYGSMVLLVIQGDMAPEGMTEVTGQEGYFSGKIQSHNVVARKDGSRLLVLVGDRPYDSLLDTMRHIVLTNP